MAIGFERCSESVVTNRGFSRRRCSRPATVQRPTGAGQAWYCGTHDPANVAKREAKKEEERRRERQSQMALLKGAENRIKLLGTGHPDWRPGGATGSIVLTAREADKIIGALKMIKSVADRHGDVDSMEISSIIEQLSGGNL